MSKHASTAAEQAKEKLGVRRDRLREEHDLVVVPSSTTSSGHLHLVGMFGPYCGKLHANAKTETLRLKPLSSYPKGYKEWCASCLYVEKYGKLPPSNDAPEVVYID